MLILTRKTGQGFLIGPDVEITITEISGDKVRIGIEAPRDIKILRTELRETVQENIHAADNISGDTLRAFAANLKKGTVLNTIPAGQEETVVKASGNTTEK